MLKKKMAEQPVYIPILTTVAEVANDFDTVFISSSLEMLNTFLENRGGAVFLPSHANTKIIVLGTSCFMLIDHTININAATIQMLSIRHCLHFIRPRTIRIT